LQFGACSKQIYKKFRHFDTFIEQSVEPFFKKFRLWRRAFILVHPLINLAKISPAAQKTTYSFSLIYCVIYEKISPAAQRFILCFSQ